MHPMQNAQAKNWPHWANYAVFGSRLFQPFYASTLESAQGYAKRWGGTVKARNPR